MQNLTRTLVEQRAAFLYGIRSAAEFHRTRFAALFRRICFAGVGELP